MTNPVLIEVRRGPLVESRHRGAVAVADAAGTMALAIGDVTTPIFPRSAVKALQALPLVERGAADRYGFGDEELALACAMGTDHAEYFRPEHPVQREVRAVLEDFTGAAMAEGRCAFDGCSVPTWAVPLRNLAHGFAKFGAGYGISPERARAAARLRQASTKKPWYVAGTGRFCTDIMQSFGERVFVKTGAEGVYCAALPHERLGIAIKCDDGGSRAAQAIVAAIIARFLPLAASERSALWRFAEPVLRNWNGFEVGQVRITEPLR